jgi:glycerophosphoryl diester phosphodiesterase
MTIRPRYTDSAIRPPQARGHWPLIVGHRGASGRLPENTLLAFRGAFEDGADGVELDVRLSADGIPVVAHDVTLRRVAGLRGRIADHSAAELAEMVTREQRLRGAAPRPVPVPVAGEVGVPSLESVIALTEPWGGRLFIELKGRRAARRRAREEGARRSDANLEQAVVEALALQGCHDRAVVISFNHAALRRVKQLDRRVVTAATIAPTLRLPRPSPARVVEAVERAGAQGAALHVSLATRRRVEALRARGLAVAAWTVNSPVVAQYLAHCGVDAIMTDFPARLAAARAAPGR